MKISANVISVSAVIAVDRDAVVLDVYLVRNVTIVERRKIDYATR